MARTKLIALDFDGTMTQYTGWRGPEAMDPPVEGARTALHILNRSARLMCLTTRDVAFVKSWLTRHGFPEMSVSNHKGPHSVLVDDRAIQFKGVWTDELIQEILHFKTWWERSSTESSSPND